MDTTFIDNTLHNVLYMIPKSIIDNIIIKYIPVVCIKYKFKIIIDMTPKDIKSRNKREHELLIRYQNMQDLKILLFNKRLNMIYYTHGDHYMLIDYKKRYIN
jgi:hypothetical protein